MFDEFSSDIKRKIAIACVDAVSGAYVTFDESTKQPVKAIVSSASIPFVFPHQVWPETGVVCMDGGSVWNTNIVSAIKRCREIVDDDSKIILDIVICDAAHVDYITNTTNTISNFYRFKDIKNSVNSLSDIVEFQRAYPGVNFRHFVQPTEPLKGNGINMINFDNATCTYDMQMQGRKDGKVAVNSGETFLSDKINDWVENKLSI